MESGYVSRGKISIATIKKIIIKTCVKQAFSLGLKLLSRFSSSLWEFNKRLLREAVPNTLIYITDVFLKSCR